MRETEQGTLDDFRGSLDDHYTENDDESWCNQRLSQTQDKMDETLLAGHEALTEAEYERLKADHRNYSGDISAIRTEAFYGAVERDCPAEDENFRLWGGGMTR